MRCGFSSREGDALEFGLDGEVWRSDLVVFKGPSPTLPRRARDCEQNAECIESMSRI